VATAKTPGKKSKGKPSSPLIYAGAKFGYLTVKQRSPKKGNSVYWVVECVCHKRETVPSFYLLRKKFPKTSCGCKSYEGANPYPETKVCWHSMHLRCYYTKHVAYKDYGGRGIKVCARWHRDNPKGWENFLKDMGPRPTVNGEQLTLDRKDPDGNYEKDNCRWADKLTQANNQRRHKQPKTTTS
jgi:hypothetical protein